MATKHKSGESDAYCRLRTNFNTQQYKTSCSVKSLTPQWNQTFRFYPADDPPTGNITVKFYERKSIFPDHHLGEIVLDISAYTGGEEHDLWFVVQDEPKKKLNARGEVHLRLRYLTVEMDASPIARTVPRKPDEKGTRNSGKVPSTPTTPTRPRTKEPSSSPVDTGPSPVAAAASKEPVKEPTTLPHTNSSVLRLEEKYELGKVLGKGAFSSVYRSKNKFTDEEVAIKVVQKRDIKPRDLELLEREIKILKKLRHPNIVRLYDLFDGPEKLYIVLELVPGGELFDQLVKNGSYSESDARSLITQVLEGVDYMHKNGVVHRDLKPDNLLCQDATHIKIADFGMSKDVPTMGMLKTAVGTPSYIAPEIIQGINQTCYDSGCDIWSVGVLTYVILSGYTPFWGNTQDQLFSRITKAVFDFPSPEWDVVSEQAKDFIKSLLTPDPGDRPSAEASLNHDWIKTKTTSKMKLPNVTRNLALMSSQKTETEFDTDDDAEGSIVIND